jgi:hypothetical protein
MSCSAGTLLPSLSSVARIRGSRLIFIPWTGDQSFTCPPSCIARGNIGSMFVSSSLEIRATSFFHGHKLFPQQLVFQWRKDDSMVIVVFVRGDALFLW